MIFDGPDRESRSISVRSGTKMSSPLDNSQSVNSSSQQVTGPEMSQSKLPHRSKSSTSLLHNARSLNTSSAVRNMTLYNISNITVNSGTATTMMRRLDSAPKHRIMMNQNNNQTRDSVGLAQSRAASKSGIQKAIGQINTAS